MLEMKKLLVNMCAGLLLLQPLTASACTLYAAQGSLVQGGGALIGKNRDFKPDPQELRVVKGAGYAYYGLFNQSESGKWGMKAGVNEKGLVAVTAMASCIPQKIRWSMERREVLRPLLEGCASVAEALEHKELFLGPKFIMLADATEIACIEVGEEGKTSVTRRQNDWLAHTNFYLDEEMAETLNMRVKESPQVRYERVCQLLGEMKKPADLHSFITLSQDRNDGPDNSLWRVGSTETISQTMASFIVELRPGGDFSGWVKYRPQVEDRGQEKIVEFSRRELFQAGNS